MPHSKFSFIDQELLKRRSTGMLRRMRSVMPLPEGKISLNGREMLNFCSNDYLGLSRNPLLGERSLEFTDLYGYGATASRLVCGNLTCFERLEAKIAALKGSEAALVFNSGFQANVSLLPALCDRHSLVIADKLSHNSLVQGGILSRAKMVRYRHNDLGNLRHLLEEGRKKSYSRIVVVTESVFSMDGDRADIGALKDLADRYEAILMVDEAHATGVFGDRGMGLTCGMGVDIVIGTFGKACGSFGAYVCCSKDISDYLVNCCSGFVYSTALPPSVLGAIEAALDLIPGMEQERKHLLEMAEFLRSSLTNLGFDTGKSESQIIPLIIGPEQETLELSSWLAEHHILASAIRPPTVEKGKSRIRLTLSALHTKEQINELIHVLSKWKYRN